MVNDNENEPAPKPDGARRKLPPIKVWVTPDERAEIEARANQTGMSRSAYLRAAGLNHPVKSKVDNEAVRELLHVAADMGRIAGLLKLWLAEKRGVGAPALDVDQMMGDFRKLQAELRAQAGELLYDR